MWTKQPWKHKNYCQLLLTCKKREKKNKSEYMDYSQVQKSRGKQKKFFYYKVDTRAYIRNEKSFFESHHIHKHYTNI